MASCIDLPDVRITRCEACDVEFKPKSSRGLVRYTLKSLVSSPYSLGKLFSGLNYESYICDACVKDLWAKTVKKGKRRCWLGNRTPRKRLGSCLTPIALGQKRINLTDTPAGMSHANTSSNTSASVNVLNIATPDQVHECQEAAEPTEPAVIAPGCADHVPQQHDYSFKTPAINYIRQGTTHKNTQRD